MITYRRYKNTDPPALVEVWNESLNARGSYPVRTPALFVHGSRDPFGGVSELRLALALIPARTALLAVDGAPHGLVRGREAPTPASDLVTGIVRAFLALADA